MHAEPQFSTHGCQFLRALLGGIDPHPETALGEAKHPPSEEGKTYFLHACLL